VRRAAALALLVALAGCGGGGDDGPKATTRVEVIEGIGSEGGFDAQKIYKVEAPGVVTVVSLFGSGGNLDEILGGGGGGGGQAGEGSGFVLNGDGEIATNAHVVTTGEGAAIKRAQQVYVEFADGNRVEAKIVGQPVAAIGSPFGQKQSLSIDVIKRSLDQLRDDGAGHYAYLGVVSVPLYPQLVDHFELDVEKGAWVQEVNPGGPAQRVGGTPITGADDLSGAIARFKPGEKVAIEVRRGGATRNLQVKLGERPLGSPARSGG
jgi:S1-C subfamily serine protease